MSESFSERIQKLRGSRTKADFARFLGIPAPMYHRYELGQVPKNENLRVIAEHCGVTVDWLLGLDNTAPMRYPLTDAATGAAEVREPPPCAGCAARDVQITELREQIAMLIRTNARLAEGGHNKAR